MHICLPDTREVRPQHGSAFLLYNVHIDGLYHCSLRYKQLLHLHQTLTKKFTNPYHQLPPFPPKKLLPLSTGQVEERRMQLEKYLQNISQDKVICNSSIFNLFLLEAQRESTRIREGQVHLDIELVNGQKIRLQIVTHDSADTVLTAVCRALGLNERYHAYFCLCLCGYDVIRDKLIIKRRLSFFESPYVTLQMAIHQQEQLQSVLSSSNNNNNDSNCRCQSCSIQQQQQSNNSTTTTTGVPHVANSMVSYVNNNHRVCCNNNGNNYHQQYHQNGNHHQQLCYQQNGNRHSFGTSPVASSSNPAASFVTHRILLKKSYWDPLYDTYILNDQQAFNLLFIQTVYDIKHSLTFVDRETYQQLESLLASDSKMEFILLARTLKYYNHVHFEPCLSDYPKPRTKVMISIGSKELNMRVLKSPKSLSPASSAVASAQAAATTITTSTTTSLNNNNSNNCNNNNNQQVNNNNLSREQILYCNSSLVPTGYHQLITKDDLVEEEYNFKVPLIRCWRLTSLETLNSNSPATSNITLNAGRRKSLSLFNSVVGSPINGNNSVCCEKNSNNTSNHHHYQSGNGGNTLLTALAGTAGSNGGACCRNSTNNNHLQYYHNQHHRCNHLDSNQFSQYELSFEYLVSKDTLKWITISSDQAIFISISLQGVVDELVSKRDGRSLYRSIVDPPLSSSSSASINGADLTNAQLLSSQQNGNNQHVNNTINQQEQHQQQQQQQNFTFMCRDGTQKVLNTNNQQLIDRFGTTLGYSPMNPYALAMARQRQQVRASVLLASSSSVGSRLSSSMGWITEATGANQNQQAAAFEISVSFFSNLEYHRNLD